MTVLPLVSLPTTDEEKRDYEHRARDAISLARFKLFDGRAPSHDDTRYFDRGALIFFGALGMRLDVRADWEIDTAATDGRELVYNPAFWLSLSFEQQVAIVAHEVLHCALGHFKRMQGRDLWLWNCATDLCLNQMVIESGLRLPDWALLPGRSPYEAFPSGLSSEEYYELLEKQAQGDGGKGDDEGREGGTGRKGKADPGGCGGVRPLPREAAEDECTAKWDQAVAEAHEVATRKAGSVSTSLERLVTSTKRANVDWRSVLREFLCRYARNDYSFSRPNRRYLSQGFYLPGLRSEELGEVCICVDTSGSIRGPQLAAFAAELEAILGTYDCSLRILYHDVVVCHEQRWASSDGPFTLEPRGGGGTSHVDVLAKADDEFPTAILALTDFVTILPSSPPTAPLLWCIIDNPNARPPWGRHVHIS